MRLRILVLLFALAVLAAPVAAEAAMLTDVLDADDGQDGIVDVSLLINYTNEFEWAKISRERNTGDAGTRLMLNQDEFDYSHVKHIMNITAKVGLYHDLEFHMNLPIHINETYEGAMTSHWRQKAWGGWYDTKTPFQDGRPSLLWDKERVFGFPSWKSIHSGFGDMTLGFSYAPLSHERDETFPDWVITFDIQVPSGKQTQPGMMASASNPYKGTGRDASKKATGEDIGVGKKLLRFILQTAISKRFNVADPYFGMNYKAPVALDGLIKNPRHEGGFLLGSEFIAYEKAPVGEKEPQWKVAFDLRFSAQIYGKGQDFNEITDPLAWRRNLTNSDPRKPWPDDPRADPAATGAAPADGYIVYPKDSNGVAYAPPYELPIEDRYTYLEGMFGMYFTIYHYLFLRMDAYVGHRTAHFLSLPESLDEETLRPSMSTPDPTTGEIKYSGYNAQINEIGKRVRKTDALVVGYYLTLGLTI